MFEIKFGERTLRTLWTNPSATINECEFAVSERGTIFYRAGSSWTEDHHHLMYGEKYSMNPDNGSVYLSRGPADFAARSGWRHWTKAELLIEFRRLGQATKFCSVFFAKTATAGLRQYTSPTTEQDARKTCEKLISWFEHPQAFLFKEVGRVKVEMTTTWN